MTQPSADAGADEASLQSEPANGRHAIAPAVQASQVTCSGETRASTGFCAITPPASASAATRQRTAPQLGTSPCSEVAAPMTIAPLKATAQPTNSPRGDPPRRKTPGGDADGYRPDVDEHGRRSRVDASLGRVQDDAVQPEPEDA